MDTSHETLTNIQMANRARIRALQKAAAGKYDEALEELLWLDEKDCLKYYNFQDEIVFTALKDNPEFKALVKKYKREKK